MNVRDKVSTRVAFGDTLSKIALEDEKVVIVSADSVRSMGLQEMEKKCPDRVFNVGIAEQNMTVVAAGLATVGYSAYATTFATFTCMRAMEQVRTFVAYPNLNVKIVGGMAGLTGSNEGVTHQAHEDIALMRSIPNMVVAIPADAVAAEEVTRVLHKHKGPGYLGLGRGASWKVFDEYHFEIGKGNTFREGTDVTLITYGPMLVRCKEAAEILEGQGVSTRIIDMTCIKPLDKEIIIKAAKETGAIVTVEDRTLMGSLGSAVCEVLSENYPIKVARIGLQDVFAESGDEDDVYDKYGMAVTDIVDAANKLIAQK